jgi:glycerol-3-phosphate acyltransferase PlsY
VDVIKGFFPVLLAGRLFHDPALAACCGFFAVAGHCYPFAIGFKGGKGMATAMGAFAALGWEPFLSSLALFTLAVAITRFVSLGSVLAAGAYPLFLLLLFHGSRSLFLWSLAISILVIVRHKGNLQRLFSGTERKLGEKNT